MDAEEFQAKVRELGAGDEWGGEDWLEYVLKMLRWSWCSTECVCRQGCRECREAMPAVMKGVLGS